MSNVHFLALWASHFQFCLQVLFDLPSSSATTRSIAFLVASSTFYDFITKKFSIRRNEIFLVFSLIDNFRELMKINKSTSVVRSIDCIKTLAGWLIFSAVLTIFDFLLKAFWVVWGHRYYYTASTTELGHFFARFKISAQYSVDTFLACSGILVSSSLLRSFDR
jgi:hypothetical protein